MAQLKIDSEWFPIFPDGRVPIQIQTGRGVLEGCAETEFYLADLSRWTDEQIFLVASRMADDREAPLSEALDYMRSGQPLPIRKSICEGASVAMELRAFV